MNSIKLPRHFPALAAASLCAILICGLSYMSVAAPPTGRSWNMTFGDEFEGTTIEHSKWVTQWGNAKGDTWNNVGWSWEVMDNDNISVHDGNMHVRAQLEGTLWKSGVVQSCKSFQQTYGYYEARIRMAPGYGYLNAFWLAPDGTWPPEIDIIECLGKEQTTGYMTSHYYASNESQATVYTGPDFTADFHTFGCDWRPDSVIYYVDGVVRARHYNPDNWLNLPMFVIFNIHVGNNWAGYPTTTAPGDMIVDWVHVYKEGPSTPTAAKVELDPVNQTAVEGGQASFSITATGSQPLTYSWLKDGVVIPWAKEAFYKIDTVKLSDNNARFSCKVSNSLGNNTSAEATLTVTSLDNFGFRKTASAPTIDGQVDAVWSNAINWDMTKTIGTISSATDLSGGFQALWDNANLYILLKVNDDQVMRGDTSLAAWQTDGVEIYLDRANEKTSSYSANDFQYRFNWGDTRPYEANGRTTGVVLAMNANSTSDGYLAEIQIPWTTLGVTPALELLLGFDVHVNDADVSGSRDGILSWWSSTDEAWRNPSLFGTVKLLAGSSTSISAQSMARSNQGSAHKIVMNSLGMRNAQKLTGQGKYYSLKGQSIVAGNSIKRNGISIYVSEKRDKR